MLTLRNVSKSFGRIAALDGLSLEVRPGEIFGLLGPNGAGKTTLIAIAVGLIPADGGAVVYGTPGRPARTNGAATIGVAPQALAVYDDLTGEENLRFFGGLHGIGGAALRSRVGWALDFVGLNERRGDRVEGYSGGMKRRLNLAAAILHDPEVIFLDEPTVGVDPQSRISIFDGISRLHEAGKTIVYTTHYMEEAERLCDRVGIIDHGRLLALDTVEELLRRHGGMSRVVLGRGDREEVIESEDPIGEVVRLRAGASGATVRIEPPDLEAVFLNLTGRNLRD